MKGLAGGEQCHMDRDRGAQEKQFGVGKMGNGNAPFLHERMPRAEKPDWGNTSVRLLGKRTETESNYKWEDINLLPSPFKGKHQRRSWDRLDPAKLPEAWQSNPQVRKRKGISLKKGTPELHKALLKETKVSAMGGNRNAKNHHLGGKKKKNPI